MPILKLQFGSSVLRELPVGADPVTIGRSPQSDIFIDNPAVSFHHAKISQESWKFYVEDLGSMNGTFLNGVRVTRAPLTHGDAITVGKHEVRFALDKQGEAPQPGATTAAAPAPATAPAAPPRPAADDSDEKYGSTMILDTKKRREMQEALAKARGMVAAERKALMGKVTILKGKAEAKEFFLTAQTSMVGKSSGCTVKLKGWFAPKMAAIITKRNDVYTISPSGKKVAVNGEAVTTHKDLKDGDALVVGKMQMQFNMVPW